MPFSFIPTHLVYSITSSKTIEKKNHGKRAKFDGEIAATELDPDMVGRYRDPVTDSYSMASQATSPTGTHNEGRANFLENRFLPLFHTKT
jgi:hypothetical protein